MVHTCVVVRCKHRKTAGSGISFYRFPTDEERRQKWINAIKCEPGWMPNDGSRLCSAHFISGKQSRNPLSPDYVPSVFPDTTSPDKKRKRTALERFEKREALKLRRRENAAKETAAQALMTLQTEALEKVQMEQDLQEEAAETLLSLQVHQPSMSCQSAQQASTSTSSPSDTVSAASIELKCRRLLEENHHLKETVEHLSLSENSFKDDDKAMKCWQTEVSTFMIQ
ncbi:THAP domain-containing protein 11-like [Patiria miniata]|uniref:THAP-type domain-containing protein n=1 Tax=Patiria miniata TaxID=46514 RepID=A0A914AHL5_PATMI|nr:THAP domain-containing protein 11-like [Patiria miniata]